MIQSMTGFGRGEYAAGNRQISVEVKTINHRYSEFNIKLPRKYAALEDRIRQRLSGAISRGKAEVFIKAEDREGSEREMYIDKTLAARYHEKIQDLAGMLDLPMDLGVTQLVNLPGVMNIEDAAEELDEAWLQLEKPLKEALEHLLDMRRKEGQRLAGDFLTRLDYLEKLRGQLSAKAPLVVEVYRQKLAGRIAELLGQQPVDEGRLVQEVAMFADRASVDEELVRLDSHFKQFRSLIAEDQPVGRKLDFLCQEMNREINTVGSKANDLEMTKIVVEMKSELEKLREQVQNIE